VALGITGSTRHAADRATPKNVVRSGDQDALVDVGARLLAADPRSLAAARFCFP
jgi:hypothetical protein